MDMMTMESVSPGPRQAVIVCSRAESTVDSRCRRSLSRNVDKRQIAALKNRQRLGLEFLLGDQLDSQHPTERLDECAIRLFSDVQNAKAALEGIKAKTHPPEMQGRLRRRMHSKPSLPSFSDDKVDPVDFILRGGRKRMFVHASKRPVLVIKPGRTHDAFPVPLLEIVNWRMAG